MQRRHDRLTSRYVIADRRTLWQSPVALTPYAGALIDAAALGALIDDAYRGAGIAPADIDTGVVILTGEALRRENAEAIARVLAERGGDLVTAAAGHRMEARLAAYGSGAARASRDLGGRVLNIDIGGGTTKLALCDRGELLWTAALDIGGRLVAVEGGRVARLETAGRHHAARAGFDLAPGAPLDAAGLARIAEGMADLLMAALAPSPPPEAAALLLTEPPGPFGVLAGVLVSGGVGEYVYGREARDFGDLGPALGRALRLRLDAWGPPLLPAEAPIRATALGASEHSVQLSGQTGFVPRPGAVLPRRNLPVVRPHLDPGADPDPAAVAAAVVAAFATLDLDPAADAALALGWAGPPDHARLLRLARGIAQGLAPRLAAGQPLHILLDGDVAQSLGHILRDELGLGPDLCVLDGLDLRPFDYIDLGRIRLPSMTVPVTIKSLLFADSGAERLRSAGALQETSP
jgi:ethanolamine utilization protein EutA